MRAIQAALAAIDGQITPDTDPSQLLVAAKCRALIEGYHYRWTEERQPIDIELTLTGKIINPETGRPATKLSQAGRVDVVAERSTGLVLIDHKTTSQDIQDPDSPYWRQLVVDSQVSHYMLLGWLNGLKFSDAVWDVIRKPAISPKLLSKAVKASAVAERTYFGKRLSQGSLDAMQIEDRETLEMYQARLAHDCTKERPEWYFQRRSVPRIDAELFEYAKELWMHSKDILSERKRELPVRNSGACMLYGTPCQYLGICSGHDTPDSDQWRRKDNVHNELSNIKGDGRNVITHSRIKCFQTCRRKHYYQYELGIEKQQEEEKEALYFGSLMHVALEAWFTFYKELCNGYDASSSVNEAGKYAAADTVAF